jgi:hypothetical protein
MVSYETTCSFDSKQPKLSDNKTFVSVASVKYRNRGVSVFRLKQNEYNRNKTEKSVKTLINILKNCIFSTFGRFLKQKCLKLSICMVNWFCYVIYNSRKFNGFSNLLCVRTLGKCTHRTPTGVRERHTCVGLMKSKTFI